MNWLSKIVQKLFIVQFFVASLLTSCNRVTSQQVSNSQSSSESAKLIVSAAASMQDVLGEIKQLYRQQYPQVDLTFNFGSSGSLQHQIEQGAPIDIFISAAPQQMDYLAAKELLLTKTRQNLVKNKLVLVVPKNNQSIDSFADLSRASTEKIALGEPNSVPAGKYAQEILTHFDLIKSIKPKAIYGKDVRQVLNYVATGNIDAGIVYLTDVAETQQVRIAATAPENSHSDVVYPVAVVKDSQHPQAAQQLLQFLLTPEAQAIFKQHGFVSSIKSR